MKRLTLSEIEAADVTAPEEEFEIPSFGGSVLLRGVMDLRRHFEIENEIQKAQAAARTGFLRDVSPDEVTMAEWIVAGVADPALSFEAALTLCRKDGGTAGRLFRRVMALSGRSEADMAGEEAALRANGFQAPVPGGLPGDAPPAPAGSGPAV